MFKPIIHNLQKYDAGFKDAQLYNKLIGMKPKFKIDLAQYAVEISEWKETVNLLLEKIRNSK